VKLIAHILSRGVVISWSGSEIVSIPDKNQGKTKKEETLATQSQPAILRHKKLISDSTRALSLLPPKLNSNKCHHKAHQNI
jgi:hypothetical protein